MAKEVYRNSRNAWQVPISLSAHETIIRLYSQKARQIRMRPAKKNESDIKNQSIWGANDEYEGEKPGDPVGNGDTFISSSPHPNTNPFFKTTMIILDDFRP